VETHGERLSHFLEALISYRRRARRFRFKSFLIGFSASLLLGAIVFLLALVAPPLAGMDITILAGAGAGTALAGLGFWGLVLRGVFFNRFHKKILKHMDHLTALKNQTRQDTWNAIRDLVFAHLKNTRGKYSLREVRQQYSCVWKVYQKGSKEIREALRELADLAPDEEEAFFKVRLGLTNEETEKHSDVL
jgi:hypothetical protein